MAPETVLVIIKPVSSNGRLGKRQHQPSSKGIKPNHDPTEIHWYVPCKIQSPSDQPRDHRSHNKGKGSGSAVRKQKHMMKQGVRAWFPKQAARYNTSKGRDDATDISYGSYPTIQLSIICMASPLAR